MLESYLLKFDLYFLNLINTILVHPWLDEFFVYITNLHHQKLFQYFIAPVLLIYFLKINWKNTFKILIVCGLVGGLSDWIAYKGIKSHVQRQRPPYVFKNDVVVRVPYLPKSPSFPSNHSMTSWAVAITLSYFLSNYKWIFFIIATLVSYSRIYVGVHYPSDVIAGAILGYILGKLIIEVFLKRIFYIVPKKYQKR